MFMIYKYTYASYIFMIYINHIHIHITYVSYIWMLLRKKILSVLTTKIKNDDMWQDGDVGDNSGGSHFAFINVSKQHVVHLKFILCYLSIINQ